MSNKTYDILKELAQVWLPAFATLVSAIGQIWGLPLSEEIALTVMAVDAFLGAGLKISSKNYYESLEVENDNQ